VPPVPETPAVPLMPAVPCAPPLDPGGTVLPPDPVELAMAVHSHIAPAAGFKQPAWHVSPSAQSEAT